MRQTAIRSLAALLALSLTASAVPAAAGWKLVPPRANVKVGAMTVISASEWNQAGKAPGKQGVAWTHDGFELNGLEILGPVASGQPIYRERNRKRNPMPKFDRTMLLPDLADLLERSLRARHGLSDFTVERSEPARLGGVAGIAVHYRYSHPNDELVRRGEARLAVSRGQLYLINFYAPSLYYYEAGLAEARAVMDGARL